MTRPQINFKEPKFLVRAILGLLLLANLIAATFAFHLIGDSPADLDARLASIRSGLLSAQLRLNKSRALAANIERSREQGDRFLAVNMTSRRHTYSEIFAETNKLVVAAGMKMGEANFAVPDPIEGSDDLDTLAMTANFEGGYSQLVKFVNLLDRSPRFLVLQSLQVSPQPKGDILNVTIKLSTFVRDDKEGAL
jgi:Tfp pilus assembly protein PilO